MTTSVKAFLAASALLTFSVSHAAVYVLGSSYSENAMPYALDDQPEWHIDCGKPLQYIYNNPQTPCETTSTIWPNALTARQFDYISFQPVAGDGITEQSDLDEIGYWMSLQPNAVVVIHPTWPIPSLWESTFHNPNPDNTLTNYAQLYYYDLIQKLKIAHPGRTIVSDRANEILDSIYHDVERGVGLLDDFQEMFSDSGGHCGGGNGRYVQHNTLRQAFGQQTGVDNTQGAFDPRLRSYFDDKVRACQPRSAAPPADDPCFVTSFAAVRDAFTVTQNKPTDPLNVLANDIGVTNPVTVTIDTPPSYGTASPVPAGPGDPSVIRIRYLPIAGYVGPDSFTYKITSGTKESYTTVLITIVADSDGDADDDLVPDASDNCTLIANPDQRDTDGDGYGNICDADLNNDGVVNINDFNRMKARLGITPVVDVDADLDGNGAVNINDLNRLRSYLGRPPGPSGLHPPH